MPDSHDVEGQRLDDRTKGRLLWGVRYLEKALDGHQVGDVDCVGFSIRPPTREKNEYLCVLRGLSDDGSPVVAFHSSAGLADTLIGVGERLRNGSLSWRPDEYRK